MLEESFLFLNIKGLNPFITSQAKAIFFIVCDILLEISIILRLTHSDLEIDNVIDVLITIVAVMQIISKEVILLIHRKKFADVIRSLEKFWPQEEFDEITARKINLIHSITIKLLKLYKCLIIISAVTYYTKPLYENQRVLPFYWENPCDTQASLICFICSYIVQVFCAVSVLSSMIGFDCLLFGLLSYGYCEFDQIKYALLNISVNEDIDGDEYLRLNDVARIVKQHNLVLRFMDQVNKLFTYSLLCQFSSNLFALCTGLFLISYNGFPPSLALTLRYAPYIISNLSQIFVYCAAGEIISGQSESVSDAAYKSNWWVKHQPKLRKAILLIIQNSQKRRRLTAGGIWNLDVLTFVAILKCSFSMLTFMQTMYQSD